MLLKNAAVLLAMLPCAVAVATTFADPLHTPECKAAQQALAAFEGLNKDAKLPRAPAASAASSADIPPRLRALRQDVARVCLASSLDAPRPQRQVQPTLSVPPVNPLQALTLPQRTNPAAANAPAVPQPALRSITSCDAAGCWASDGTRLQRMGPNLVGPKGVCQVSGSVVSCP